MSGADELGKFLGKRVAFLRGPLTEAASEPAAVAAI